MTFKKFSLLMIISAFFVVFPNLFAPEVVIEKNPYIEKYTDEFVQERGVDKVADDINRDEKYLDDQRETLMKDMREALIKAQGKGEKSEELKKYNEIVENLGKNSKAREQLGQIKTDLEKKYLALKKQLEKTTTVIDQPIVEPRKPVNWFSRALDKIKSWIKQFDLKWFEGTDLALSKKIDSIRVNLDGLASDILDPKVQDLAKKQDEFGGLIDIIEEQTFTNIAKFKLYQEQLDAGTLDATAKKQAKTDFSDVAKELIAAERALDYEHDPAADQLKKDIKNTIANLEITAQERQAFEQEVGLPPAPPTELDKIEKLSAEIEKGSKNLKEWITEDPRYFTLNNPNYREFMKKLTQLEGVDLEKIPDVIDRAQIAYTIDSSYADFLNALNSELEGNKKLPLSEKNNLIDKIATVRNRLTATTAKLSKYYGDVVDKTGRYIPTKNGPLPEGYTVKYLKTEPNITRLLKAITQEDNFTNVILREEKYNQLNDYVGKYIVKDILLDSNGQTRPVNIESVLAKEYLANEVYGKLEEDIRNFKFKKLDKAIKIDTPELKALLSDVMSRVELLTRDIPFDRNMLYAIEKGIEDGQNPIVTQIDRPIDEGAPYKETNPSKKEQLIKTIEEEKTKYNDQQVLSTASFNEINDKIENRYQYNLSGDDVAFLNKIKWDKLSIKELKGYNQEKLSDEDKENISGTIKMKEDIGKNEKNKKAVGLFERVKQGLKLRTTRFKESELYGIAKRMSEALGQKFRFQQTGNQRGLDQLEQDKQLD